MTSNSCRQFIAALSLLCALGPLNSDLHANDKNASVREPTAKASTLQDANMAAVVTEEAASTSDLPRGNGAATNGTGESAIDIKPTPISDQVSPAESPEANPNRPSSSNSAEVLDPGVLQLEYGYTKAWEPAGARQTTLGGELRFGVWRNLEFRWGSSPLVGNQASHALTLGIGDQYFSGQFQFRKQSKKSPALAVSYAVTVPTGNASLGFGAGRVNHSWTFLVSKDLHGVTLDFNAQYALIGREIDSGHNRNAVFYVALQRTLFGPLSVVGEFGEGTRLDPQTPANSTTLAALSYRLSRRTVIDAAIDVGITRGAPQKRIMFGITHVIGKLY